MAMCFLLGQRIRRKRKMGTKGATRVSCLSSESHLVSIYLWDMICSHERDKLQVLSFCYVNRVDKQAFRLFINLLMVINLGANCSSVKHSWHKTRVCDWQSRRCANIKRESFAHLHYPFHFFQHLRGWQHPPQWGDNDKRLMTGRLPKPTRANVTLRERVVVIFECWTGRTSTFRLLWFSPTDVQIWHQQLRLMFRTDTLRKQTWVFN